MNTEHLTVWCA